jgi:hypothetical protein
MPLPWRGPKSDTLLVRVARDASRRFTPRRRRLGRSTLAYMLEVTEASRRLRQRTRSPLRGATVVLVDDVRDRARDYGSIPWPSRHRYTPAGKCRERRNGSRRLPPGGEGAAPISSDLLGRETGPRDGQAGYDIGGHGADGKVDINPFVPKNQR